MTQNHDHQQPSRRTLLKLAGAAGLAAGAVAVSGTAGAAAAPAPAFAHPGLLHSHADLRWTAAKVKAGAQP